MKILYDFQIFTTQQYGGISRYFNELTLAQRFNSKVSILVSLNEYFSTHKNFSKFYKNVYFRALVYRLNKLFTIFLLKTSDYSIFHPTYYDPYFLKYLKSPFVLTIYDMIHEKYPEYFPETYTMRNKKILAEKALKIIAISENTKKDIIEILNIDANKIEVIPLASSIKIEDFNLNETIPSRYILFVGGRSGYKNFNKFISSISKLLNRDEELKVLCLGGGNFTPSESLLFDELKINGQILHHDLDDHKMYYYYMNALCFVFPSLYEGFGLPILEAFNCKCPVVLSNTSSFPEVALDAAAYFDPNEENSIYEAVKTVVESPNLREEMRKRGIERSRDFSWEITVDKTHVFYQTCLESFAQGAHNL